MVDRALLRRAGLIALAVAVVVCFAGLFQRGLWTPDEPREAEVGREMLQSGFSAMPTLAGVTFMEKPPLFAWATAASYAVFGYADWAGRIPTALFAIGSIGVAYLIGRRLAGRLAGLCSAVVLATTWQFSETSHKVSLDVALTFFVAGGHFAFLSLWRPRRRSAGMYAVIGVCAGLAFLTKGVIGPALMCAPPILAAAAMREWEYVKRVLPRAAAAATAGVAAFGIPWVVALVNTPGGGWPAVETCLWANTFGRSVAEDGAQFSAHVKPPHYYLLAWFYVVGPWCLALPAVLKAGVLSRGGRGGRTLFLGLVFVAGLALLSVPSTKREIYLLPFVPVASVVLGVWLSRVGRSAGGAWDAAALKTLGIVATTAFVAVTLALGYVALGLPLPTSAPGSSDPSTFDLLAAERGAVAWYCVAAGAWTLTVHAWIKRRLVPREARGLQVAAGVFTTFVVLHGAGFPAFDPVRDMSEGAREIASLVPEGEPVLTLRGDETLWSIVPFYTGRAVENAATSPQAITAIDAGRATHVVVPEKHDERITPALRERLVFVRSVRLNSTRTVDVYRVRAP